MGDYLKLIDAGAELAGLKDELDLIEALADTAQKWALVASNIEGATTLDKFLDTLAKDISGDQVKQAFELAGLGDAHATLARLMGKLTAGADKIPDQVKTLFNPLSTFANGSSGVVEWTLSGKEEARLGTRITLGLQGGGALRFDAAGKAKIGETELDRLLRIGASLNAKASAAGTLPIRWGTIKGTADASVAVSLDYLFQPSNRSTLYAAAIAERIVALPDPFDYGSVWKAFQAAELGLAGLVYSFTDSASAKVDLAVSASGSLTKDILADVKLTFGVRGSRESKFLLGLRKVPQGIEATLSRGSAHEAGATLGITVGFDLSAPVGRVREVLNRAVAKSDEVIGKITPYLTPGTWLRKQFHEELGAAAERLIRNEALRKAVLADLESATGEREAGDPAIVAHLTAILTDAVDDQAKKLTNLAEDARDGIVGQILAALPEPVRAPAADQLRVELKPFVDHAVKGLKGALEDLVDNHRDKLKGALKKLNVELSGAVDRADQLLEPVRKLIDQYNQLLTKAKEFANDAARAKAVAKISQDELWTWGAEEKLVGTFTAESEAATRLFETISRGKVDKLRELLLSGSPTADFDLDESASYLKRSAGRTSTTNVEVVLFGFGATGSVKIDGHADILIDGNGDVQVDAKGKLEERFKGGGEEREVSFVNTFQLRLAKALASTAGGQRSIEAGVTISDKDQSMKLEELTGFIRSLEKTSLVAGHIDELAAAQFAAWLPAGKRALAADLKAKLQLSHEEMTKLMMLGQRTNGRLTKDALLTIIRTSIAALDEARVRKIAAVNAGVTTLVRELGLPRRELPEFILDRMNGDTDLKELERQYPPRGSFDRPAEVHEFLNELKYASALCTIIQRIGDIYTATPAVGAGALRDGMDEGGYADAQKSVAQAGARWLSTGGGLKLSPEVTPTTLAFMIAICALAGIPRVKRENRNMTGHGPAEAAEIMTLSMSRRDGDKIKETVGLTQAS